jgi:hypothetical protein
MVNGFSGAHYIDKFRHGDGFMNPRIARRHVGFPLRIVQRQGIEQSRTLFRGVITLWDDFGGGVEG